MNELFESALVLSCSTKPQDCSTAAYLIKFVIQLPEMCIILQKQLSNRNISVTQTDSCGMILSG